MIGWEAMQGVQQAFRNCWDQFLAQASIPMLESDTAASEPTYSRRIPPSYRRCGDQAPDAIDLLVDEQIFNGLRHGKGQW